MNRYESIDRDTFVTNSSVNPSNETSQAKILVEKENIDFDYGPLTKKSKKDI